MWIEMTKYHFEKRGVEIAGRWGMGNSRSGRIFQTLNVRRGWWGSSLWDKWDVDPAEEVQMNNDSGRHTFLWHRRWTNIFDVVINTINDLYGMGIWTYIMCYRLMSHSPSACTFTLLSGDINSTKHKTTDYKGWEKKDVGKWGMGVRAPQEQNRENEIRCW